MEFRDYWEALLGSKVKVKVLLYLLSEGVPTSEHEIARILGVSHTAVNKTMKRFHELNIVLPMRIGNINAWKINEQSYAYGVLRNFRITPPIEHLKLAIQSSLGSYKHHITVTLIGSVAEGRELPNSDIDLLVIMKNPEHRKEIIKSITNLADRCMSLYGNKLSPIVLTLKEAEKPKNKKLLEEAEKKGIRVIG